MDIQIELLSGHHDRKAFDCGESSLNQWLGRMALQQQRKNYARTRVVVETQHPHRILGYYALLAHQIDTTHFPSDRSLPQRLPAVLLARLAVDLTARGRGLGKALLFDAIERTRTLAGEAAAIGLIVDALTDEAARFYAAYGFEAFRDDPRRLLLLI